MSRIRSIDTFRGICMAWMYLGHLLEWWIKPEYIFINTFTHQILDSVGASGFLFISGVSIALSFSKKNNNKELSKDFVKKSYLIRALLLFIVALLYNLPIAIFLNNLAAIWMWFVLLTASISLIIAWPLLKLKIIMRIVIGITLWIINLYLFNILNPFRGQVSPFGILFHILYNEPQLDPILNFFPFFLFGTVYGDYISRLEYKEGLLRDKNTFRINKLYLLFIISIIFIIFGIFFDFPDFLIRSTISWNFYSLGIELLLLTSLLSYEFLFKYKPKKSYKFLFYFSYYSFTVYLVHHLLYFLFLDKLNYISIWFAILAAFILSGMILRSIYKYLGQNASIKAILKRISIHIVKKL